MEPYSTEKSQESQTTAQTHFDKNKTALLKGAKVAVTLGPLVEEILNASNS